MRFFSIFSILAIIGLSSCHSVNEHWKEESESLNMIHQQMSGLTDVIVRDIFSPPAASRNYVYPSIAAYETIRLQDESSKSLQGQVNGLSDLPTLDEEVDYNFPLATQYAFLATAKHFVFSEDKINEKIDALVADYEKVNMPKAVFERSIAFAKQMSKAVIDYANKDNYNQTRSYPKFNVTEAPYEWKPTPPAYMEAIEPHWREIRTFVIDSAQQFKPDFPTPVDISKGSQFHNEMMEVYDVVKNANEEEKEIASFWDCNPYVMNVTGHVMHATKKITPGGHWMEIVRIACENTDADLLTSAKAYVYTSLALADGFISCWDEKYRSNLIRPETIINETIDPDWIPLLQTPPFPEYTSGHSVISTAAATVLTDMFGDNFAFTDDSEVKYGLTIRKFNSFLEASAEAAVSRLYGGIHYRPAIENGVTQGAALGDHIVNTLKF